MRSGRVLFIVGGVFFVIAIIAGAIYLFGRGDRDGSTGQGAQGTPRPTPTPANVREIVVAAQSIIPRGTRITAENNAVKLATWPLEAVPPGTLTNLEDAYGLIARVDIILDMPITEGMLTEQAGDLAAVGSDAALQIPPGKVAYALPIARWSSVAWAIQPGDHVDVLVSFLVQELDEDYQTPLPGKKIACSGIQMTEEGGIELACVDVPVGRVDFVNGIMMIEGPSGAQRPGLVTQMMVQDVVVLRVGDWPEPSPLRTQPQPVEGEEEEAQAGGAQPTPAPERDDIMAVTVIVTPQDAMVLKYAEEIGASMDLVLRSADDANKVVATDSVTLQYVFERFNVEIPPKLPYGVTPPLQLLKPGLVGESNPLNVDGGRVGTKATN